MYVKEIAKNGFFWVNQEILFPAIKLFHAVLLSHFLNSWCGFSPAMTIQTSHHRSGAWFTCHGTSVLAIVTT